MASVFIVEQTETVIHLEIETSQGPVAIVADYLWEQSVRMLVFDRVHVEGAGSGTLGRKGLNELKAALAEFGGQRGASVLIFQGGKRTSGRQIGKNPATIIIPCQ